jgi:uncharacterized protein (TIGR03435 family)
VHKALNVAVAVAVILSGLPVATAQVAFEAASITLVDEGAPFGNNVADPVRLDYPKVTMIELLEQAFDAKVDQIAGGPDWARSAAGPPYYHLQAAMPAGTSKEQKKLMLQHLLAERFHLSVHHEARNFPGYKLAVASKGPKLKEAPPVKNLTPEEIAENFAKLPPQEARALVMASRPSLSIGPGRMRMTYPSESMADFAGELGNLINKALDHPLGSPVPRVADGTGLPGKYVFTLEFLCAGCRGINPSRLPLLQRSTSTESSANTSAPASEPVGGGLPTIFVALESQLGLRLQKAEDVQGDVVVIEHIEKTPAAN